MFFLEPPELPQHEIIFLSGQPKGIVFRSGRLNGSCQCSFALFFSFINRISHVDLLMSCKVFFLGNQLWCSMKNCNLKLILPSFNESFYLFHSEPGLAVLLYFVAMSKKRDTSERESCFPQTSSNYIYIYIHMCVFLIMYIYECMYIYIYEVSTHITLVHTPFSPHVIS